MFRIGTKLGISNGVLVALCIVIGAVAYRQTQVVRQNVEEVVEVREPVNSAVYALRNNLTESAFATLGYLSTGDSVLLAAFNSNKEQLPHIQIRFREAEGQGGEGSVETDLQRGFAQVQSIADAQIGLLDLQNRTMQSLLQVLDALDGLLVERIQASVSVEDPIAYRRLQSVLEMKANVNAITKGLGTYLATGKPQFERRIQLAESEFERFFKVYQYVLLSPEEKQWSTELRRLSTRCMVQAKSVIALDKQRRKHLVQFLAANRELGTMLDDRIQQRTEQGLTEAKANLLRAGEQARTSILIALVLSVVFGLVAGYITTKSITDPLRQLSSVMLAIARGDRAQKVDLATSDELRSLGEAFNQMTGQLLQVNEELRGEVAERRRAEEEIRMLAHTVTSMHESVAISDSDDTILSVNPAFCRIYGYSEEECIGLSAKALNLRSELESTPEPSSHTLHADGWSGELMATRKNGERFPVLVSTSVVRDEPGLPKAMVTISRDITDQKRLQKKLEDAEHERMVALRRFALSVQRAQEDERARISRELHDDLCQRLSGMKFRVEVLEDEVTAADKRARRRLRGFAQELDRTIVDVRRISSNLRPSALDDFGLVTALKMLCKDFEKVHSIRTMFQPGSTPLKRVDPSIEIALYRIAQEALSNVAKHAGAGTVALRLLYDDSRLRLVIRDDGKGFDRETATRVKPSGHGFGLISMRERTELLGGTFEVDSAEGKGTTITSTIPLGDLADHETNQNTDRG